MTDRLALVLVTAGFIASALLHLATFTRLEPPGADGLVLALFLAGFPPLIVLLARLREDARGEAGAGGRLATLRLLASRVPEPMRWLAFGLVLYSAMNFALSLLLGWEDGDPVGRRVATGQLLLIYLIPLLYFRFVRRAASGSRPGRPAPPA